MITRFAPSPTGPLHLGHAYSAILAHDMARAAGGRFLLRIEDTDLQRSKPEWETLIFEDMRWLGLTWDGPVLRQSEHLPRYFAALDQLAAMDLLYPCACTRADIRAALSAPQEGAPHEVYPGTCKSRSYDSRQPGEALRLHMDRALACLGPLAFSEEGPLHPGTHRINPAEAIAHLGDVVLHRKDQNTVAYALASALDDAAQMITHVIRGDDLFEFTPLQVILQSLLDLPTPLYHHHKLIRDDAGKRLAKRDDARAIRKYRADGWTSASLRQQLAL